MFSCLSPSSIADVLRVGNADCVADQIVALSPCTSATAQELPIDACIWYGWLYVALTTVDAAFRLASTSPESTSSVSRAGCLRSCEYRSACGDNAVPGVQVTLSRSAPCIACHGFCATTPTKLPLTTTLTIPGSSRIELSS